MAHPLPAEDLVEELAHGGVGGHARRLAEEDLADVDGQVRVGVDVLGQRPGLRIEPAEVAGVAAVAVELDVREVGTVAVEGPQGFEGGRARCRAGRGSGRAGASGGAGPARRRPLAISVRIWRGVTSKWRDDVVERRDVPRALLPGLDAAGVHHLDAKPLVASSIQRRTP